jgi:excisionase family DNA binding protein
MKPLKSVEEAAGLLGISPWTVRGYIRDGKLRPVRIGRRVLLQEEELQGFVEGARTSWGSAARQVQEGTRAGVQNQGAEENENA